MPGSESLPFQVLLVEDNPGDAELVRLALEAAGARTQVHHTETLEDALAHARTAPVDVILLDLNLPDASGMEGVRALQESFPSLPIVVLTGGVPGHGVDAVAAGAQDFLSKQSLDGHVLERAIRYAIERQRHARRVEELAAERASRHAAESAARLLDLSYRVAAAGLTHEDSRESLHAVVREVRLGFQSDSATLFLAGEDGASFTVAASEGVGDCEGERVPQESVTGSIASSGAARAIPDLAGEGAAFPALRGLVSLMGTPVRSRGRTIGVLHVGSFHHREFTPSEVRMLESLGSRIALVVENARLRERARFEEARWRSVVETMADMVCLADPGGAVRYGNDALRRWLGDLPVTVVGLPPEGPPDHLRRLDGTPLPREEHPLARAARGEEVREVDLLLRRERGEERIASWTASLIRDEKGNTQAILLVGHDVTERNRAEQALREADRRKDEFLAVLSHELRNPLAPVHNSVYLLKRAPPGSDTATRALQVIDRQVRHMSRLIEDLLEVSRITSGKVQLQRERIDLREVARRVLEDVDSVFAGRGLDFRANLPGHPTWLDGDPVRLAQTITNLLYNAAKFTPSGGRVDLFLEEEDSTVVLRVVDSGAGISEEMLGRLFQPFSQADRTLHRSAGGLGLGLATVKGFVELHGGTVSASSEGPGKGAEFTVRLPAAPAGPVLAEASSPATSEAAPRTCRVLIIEDNVDAAESLKEAIEAECSAVAVAHAGGEGLEMAREFHPEVVLCDIGLPEMDGYEVARRLRSDPQLSSTYLVALTGYAGPEDRRRALEAGFDLHLAKPLDLDDVEKILFAAGPCRRVGETTAAFGV